MKITTHLFRCPLPCTFLQSIRSVNARALSFSVWHVFIQLGNHTIASHCRNVLHAFSGGDKHHDALLKAFMSFTIGQELGLDCLHSCHPPLLWEGMKVCYCAPSRLMCKVLCSPASAASIEQSSKVNKRVQTCNKGRSVNGKMEWQVFISHRKLLLNRKLEFKR